MSQKTVAVVGAGIAGLASAIRLANQGMDVHLFEKNSYTGGKMTFLRRYRQYLLRQ
jgi:phytoene dehydrogenase-like protein